MSDVVFPLLCRKTDADTEASRDFFTKVLTSDRERLGLLSRLELNSSSRSYSLERGCLDLQSSSFLIPYRMQGHIDHQQQQFLVSMTIKTSSGTTVIDLMSLLFLPLIIYITRFYYYNIWSSMFSQPKDNSLLWQTLSRTFDHLVWLLCLGYAVLVMLEERRDDGRKDLSLYSTLLTN